MRVSKVRKSVQDRRNALTVSGWKCVCVCVCWQLRKCAQMHMQNRERESEREIDSVKGVWRGAGDSSESFYANHAQRALNLPAAWAEI